MINRAILQSDTNKLVIIIIGVRRDQCNLIWKYMSYNEDISEEGTYILMDYYIDGQKLSSTENHLYLGVLLPNFPCGKCCVKAKKSLCVLKA